VHVVFVGRIARPASAWSIDFDDQQAVGGEVRLENVIDLSRCVAAAADANAIRAFAASSIDT
jgi:hypothetical protein